MDIRPLMLLARAISARYGVIVQFTNADTACCVYRNGSYTIELPLSASENADMLYRGFIDHEVGHVRFTEFSGSGDQRSDLEKSLANIFEDEFVERRMGALFPGSKINLRNLARHIFNAGHAQEALQGDIVAKLFAFALYHRRSLLDPELGQWNAEIDDAVRKAGIPDIVFAQMLVLVGRPTDSTAENNALAHELYDLLRMYIPEAAPVPDGFSVGARVADELKNTAAPSDSLTVQLNEGSQLAAGAANDSVRKKASPCVLEESMVSALRKRIPPLLQSSRIKPCVVSTRGKLYGKHLARVAVLDARVFHAPARKVEQEIEVGFLLDYSASMRALCADLDKAVYATLVMLKALPKVKSFAYGFHGDVYAKLVGKEEAKVHQFYGLRPTSSTPLGAAMLNITAEFASTGRRILIITTDGQPDRGVDATIPIVSMLENMGIEIYAVGLGFSARYLERLFDQHHYAVLQDIAEYPACLEAMLYKAIICKN